jgi:hypothetical protein
MKRGPVRKKLPVTVRSEAAATEVTEAVTEADAEMTEADAEMTEADAEMTEATAAGNLLHSLL